MKFALLTAVVLSLPQLQDPNAGVDPSSPGGFREWVKNTAKAIGRIPSHLREDFKSSKEGRPLDGGQNTVVKQTETTEDPSNPDKTTTRSTKTVSSTNPLDKMSDEEPPVRRMKGKNMSGEKDLEMTSVPPTMPTDRSARSRTPLGDESDGSKKPLSSASQRSITAPEDDSPVESHVTTQTISREKPAGAAKHQLPHAPEDEGPIASSSSAQVISGDKPTSAKHQAPHAPEQQMDIGHVVPPVEKSRPVDKEVPPSSELEEPLAKAPASSATDERSLTQPPSEKPVRRVQRTVETTVTKDDTKSGGTEQRNQESVESQSNTNASPTSVTLP